jgi:hypothetical protein
MPLCQSLDSFCLRREPGFTRISAKAEREGDCSPLAEASGNMENRDNLGCSGDKRLR